MTTFIFKVLTAGWVQLCKIML